VLVVLYIVIKYENIGFLNLMKISLPRDI